MALQRCWAYVWALGVAGRCLGGVVWSSREREERKSQRKQLEGAVILQQQHGVE